MFGMSQGGNKGGELDLSNFRKKYDQINAKYKQLYDERMPVLQEYEKNSQTQLAELIGATAPQAKLLFEQANKLGAAADQQYQSALGYDTQERRADERGKAMSDVGTAADAAKQQALDRLESYGIDPSQTRSAGLDSGLQMAKTLQQVKAASDAEQGVEQRGRAYVGDAIQGMGGALQAAGSASAIGTEMLQGNLQATNRTSALYGEMFGTPMTNLDRQTNINTMKMNSKMNEWGANAQSEQGGGGGLSALGSMAGMAAGAYFGAGNPMAMQAGAMAGGAFGGWAES